MLDAEKYVIIFHQEPKRHLRSQKCPYWVQIPKSPFPNYSLSFLFRKCSTSYMIPGHLGLAREGFRFLAFTPIDRPSSYTACFGGVGARCPGLHLPPMAFGGPT
jgi:hypothetical protein